MPRSESERIYEIVGKLVPRTSTASVLFHHAVAERLWLGPTDHKCLHLLRERGPMTGSDLVAATGLTSGAISGVVARLERAGYVRREPDPNDGRRQTLHPVAERGPELKAVFQPLREDASTWLERYDVDQLDVIADFLTGLTTLISRHTTLLRAETLSAAGRAEEVAPVGSRGAERTTDGSEDTQSGDTTHG